MMIPANSGGIKAENRILTFFEMDEILLTEALE